MSDEKKETTPQINEEKTPVNDTPTDVQSPEATESSDVAAEVTEEVVAQQAEETLPAEEISVPELRSGMTIRVHLKLKEGEKERIQVFQGIITALRGKTPETKTMTVQKNSFGVIVEKILPLASPLIDKIEVVKRAKVRRSKLYFLKKGYRKRLKETLEK